MPLSRLSPRSKRSGLAKRNSRNRAGNSQRHLQLWAAIKNTRTELEKWQQQVEMVETLFNRHIVPLEYQLVESVCNVTQTVMSVFAASTQSVANQSLLGLWVNDNLNSLQNHPFADASRVSRLSASWMDLLNREGSVENQLALLANKQRSNTGQQQQGSEYEKNGRENYEQQNIEEDEELLFDFGMHSKSNNDSLRNNQNTKASEPDANTHFHEEEILDEANQHDRHTNEDTSRANLDEKVASLEDKLSVERLFRQLAKALHPDREQCEVAKAEKHVLMSECLEARKNKDINKLLTLYCEHVGELPDDLTNDSHNELVVALEAQLNQLQQELRQKRFGDPLQAMIVERYSASSRRECEKKINNHAASLEAEIDTTNRLVTQLNSSSGLEDALLERRAIELDKLSIDEMTGN